MKLLPMSDFVLEIAKQRKENEEHGWDYTSSDFNRVLNYAQFLKQPLTLGMFVPCDEDGNVLEEPKEDDLNMSWFEKTELYNKEKEYDKAKEKVLFDGFEYVSETKETWLFKINGNFPRIIGKKLTIESLKMFKDQIQLTITSIKQIGL